MFSLTFIATITFNKRKTWKTSRNHQSVTLDYKGQILCSVTLHFHGLNPWPSNQMVATLPTTKKRYQFEEQILSLHLFFSSLYKTRKCHENQEWTSQTKTSSCNLLKKQTKTSSCNLLKIKIKEQNFLFSSNLNHPEFPRFSPHFIIIHLLTALLLVHKSKNLSTSYLISSLISAIFQAQSPSYRRKVKQI